MSEATAGQEPTKEDYGHWAIMWAILFMMALSIVGAALLTIFHLGVIP